MKMSKPYEFIWCREQTIPQRGYKRIPTSEGILLELQLDVPKNKQKFTRGNTQPLPTGPILELPGVYIAKNIDLKQII